MSLPFLRPMGLPRPSTFKHFLGIARASTTATTSTIPIPTAPSPKTSSTKTLPKPYLVTRTQTNNLPVYLLSKRGGNLKQTKVRRIEGDIGVLRSDLQHALKLEENEVVVNQLTQQIIVKGHKKEEVLKFLEESKF